MNSNSTLWDMVSKNPLIKIISFFGGITALASMSDTVISWRDFIVDYINLYHLIINDFIYYYLFYFLPFKFPDALLDYLTFAWLMALSISKDDPPLGLSAKEKTLEFITYMLLWPVLLLYPVIEAVHAINAYSKNEKYKFLYAYSTYTWILIILFSFGGLVVINQVLNKW